MACTALCVSVDGQLDSKMSVTQVTYLQETFDSTSSECLSRSAGIACKSAQKLQKLACRGLRESVVSLPDSANAIGKCFILRGLL